MPESPCEAVADPQTNSKNNRSFQLGWAGSGAIGWIFVLSSKWLWENFFIKPVVKGKQPGRSASFFRLRERKQAGPTWPAEWSLLPAQILGVGLCSAAWISVSVVLAPPAIELKFRPAVLTLNNYFDIFIVLDSEPMDNDQLQYEQPRAAIGVE